MLWLGFQSSAGYSSIEAVEGKNATRKPQLCSHRFRPFPDSETNTNPAVQKVNSYSPIETRYLSPLSRLLAGGLSRLEIGDVRIDRGGFVLTKTVV